MYDNIKYISIDKFNKPSTDINDYQFNRYASCIVLKGKKGNVIDRPKYTYEKYECLVISVYYKIKNYYNNEIENNAAQIIESYNNNCITFNQSNIKIFKNLYYINTFTILGYHLNFDELYSLYLDNNRNEIITERRLINNILDLINYNEVDKFETFNDIIESLNNNLDFKSNLNSKNLYHTYKIANDTYLDNEIISCSHRNYFNLKNSLNLYRTYNSYHLIKLIYLCEKNGFDNLIFGWSPLSLGDQYYKIYYHNPNDLNYKFILPNLFTNMNFSDERLINNLNYISFKDINETKLTTSKISHNTSNKYYNKIENLLEIKLFDYQKNISWMSKIENNKPLFNTDFNINNLKFDYKFKYKNVEVYNPIDKFKKIKNMF